jgi:hypothetical protein
MPSTAQNSPDKDPIVENMQQNGMSTTGILKALAAPLLKDLNLPKDASAMIIASDTVVAQTDYSVKQNIEVSDVIMDKVGAMCELIENIVDKKPKAISTEFIENFNTLVAKTNTNSSELWKLLDEVKKSVQDKNVTQSELLSMSQNGKISGAELVQKLRDQHEKIKLYNLTAKNSLMGQSNMITMNQSSTERPLEKTQTEIVRLMNYNRLTLDNVQKKPSATQSSSSEMERAEPERAAPEAQKAVPEAQTAKATTDTKAPDITGETRREGREGETGGGLHR